MTDVQAAIGREQLRKLPEIVRRRRAIADRYARELHDVQGFMLPGDLHWTRTNWQSYCVRLQHGQSQTRVMQSMLDDGVATRRGIMCAHREPAYPARTWSSRNQTLHESERAQDECILLPLYPQMTGEEQDRVIDSLRRAANATA